MNPHLAASVAVGVAFSAIAMSCADRDMAAILGDFDNASAVGDATAGHRRQLLVIELRRHGAAALPAWIDLLGRGKFNTHQLAAEELGDLGVAAKVAIPVLAQFLRDGFPGMQPAATTSVQERFDTGDLSRKYARRALGKIGAPAVDAVRAVLTDERSWARQEAVLTLGEMQAGARPSVLDVCACLADGDKAVVTAAAWALGQIGHVDPAVLSALQKALTDPERLVRLVTLQTLARFGPAAATTAEAVRKLEQDDDPEVRQTATDTLTRVVPTTTPTTTPTTVPKKTEGPPLRKKD